MDSSAPVAPAPLQQPPMDPLPIIFPPAHEVTFTNTILTASAPATSAPAALPGHPPYAQMITEAITALKERNGSSKKAIAKYIERVYSNLPGTHSALLTHHLKRLKEAGQLVMVKHSYKLPGSASQVQANGPKRGPGRPPKAKSAAENVQAQQVPVPVLQPQPPVNATGGPEPIAIPESVFASLGLVDGPSPVAAKKRPGRPRKAGAVGVGLQPNPTVVKKRAGRPPKNAASNAAPATVAGGRPRGRPPKIAAGVTGKRRGRPSKNLPHPAAVAGATDPVLVPTGYVADTATAVAPALPTVAAIPTAAVPALKRRGRPLKATEGPKKPRKLSGKPLGRPKKNAATAVQVSSLQQSMAYQELKSKLDFFQSRIKQTVGVLKPCFDGQSAASALAALQELEELAATDVTAPLQSQQPPPSENQA